MNIEPIRYQWLDGQLKRFSDRLVAAVGLDEQEAAKVATSVAAEVRFLEPVARGQILAVSPVPLRDRLDELRAFQEWMELASKITGSAAVTRAQVITQNYVCFVYLGEACFRAPSKGLQAWFGDAALLHLPHQQSGPCFSQFDRTFKLDVCSWLRRSRVLGEKRL